jgi:hypothetical protein
MVCVCVLGGCRAVFENTGDPSPSTSQVLPSTGSKGVFALWQGQMYLMCKASHPSRSPPPAPTIQRCPPAAQVRLAHRRERRQGQPQAHQGDSGGAAEEGLEVDRLLNLLQFPWRSASFEPTRAVELFVAVRLH